MKTPPRAWIVADPIDASKYASLEADPVFLQLLLNRGLLSEAKTKDQLDRFLEPDYDSELGDPMLMPNMDRAIERVAKALQDKEKIALFCDYDADGVTAATVLSDFFRDFAQVEDLPVYLPDRMAEGYGMNSEAIDTLADQGVKLIVTADLGVSNTEEIDHAATRGVDVVVLDHHLPPPDLDPKYIVVDAKIEGHSYPFDGMCAAGMAFTFVRAFIDEHVELLPGYSPGQEKWLLDAVAIGTVADCMPLVDENRVLVTYGLKVLSRTRRLGLKAMMERANLKPEDVTAGRIGFTIGPRINAAGRVKHANTAYELLTTHDEAEASRLADEVEKTNKERQDLTVSLYESCVEQLGDPGDARVLVCAGEEWPQGVVGIVSGRVTEQFARPSFVLSLRKDGTVTGSGRSVKGFDLVEAIRSQKDLLTNFGGHKMAAGCSMEGKDLEAFKKGIAEYAEEHLPSDLLQKTLEIDLELPLAHVDWDLVNLVEKFAPTGIANPQPLFVSRGVEVADVRTVGSDDDHLKMRLKAEDCSGKEGCVTVEKDAELDPDAPVRCRATSCLLETIGFGLGDHAENISTGDVVDVAYGVEVNEWNGKRTIQLRLVDLQKTS